MNNKNGTYRVILEGLKEKELAEMMAARLVKGTKEAGLTVRIEQIIEEVTE